VSLAKLRIVPEKRGGRLQFDDGDAIVAMFNPDELSFNRSVGWQTQGAAQRDTPELQFTNSEPRTLSVKLFFDTYDTPDLPKDDVRKKHTDKVLALTTVESHGDKHRPPVCRLRWGSAGYFFQGVLERLDQRFTMFMDDGTPVRATLTCSFKEWRTNYDDLNRQNRQSADVAKRKVVRRGDTLAGIAAEEYLDPASWRPIAEANGIDDPLRLVPGTTLTVPRLTPGRERPPQTR
jgi:nucleoid-associated protein YgaU